MKVEVLYRAKREWTSVQSDSNSNSPSANCLLPGSVGTVWKKDFLVGVPISIVCWIVGNRYRETVRLPSGIGISATQHVDLLAFYRHNPTNPIADRLPIDDCIEI